MSALFSEYFKFIALVFKNKDTAIVNGFIGLGTIISQTAYNILAFNCPCAPKENYLYGMAAIGVPALTLFVIGVILNQNTWDIVSECSNRKCQKLSGTAAFALLGSIVGRAAVAPITWSVISLLRGQAYVCAFSEFIDPSSVDNFPPTKDAAKIMALFPCKDLPAPLLNYSGEVERRLKYESQLLGWLMVGVVSLSVFLLLCIKHCCSSLGYQQEAYWSHYRSNEKALFQRTAEVHAKLNAANNVKTFFGFVEMENQEKELLEKCQGARSVIPSLDWNRITGVYMYREINEAPMYSRLNKWAYYTNDNSNQHMSETDLA
ncbi:calcium homeostasis modulator protein 2-like [Triplophysa dalaica]|uniref:calcium homeostasis modulator protein 2-like n=1 Tax=Triplophysa dalaica TaxID=1582913 RepID=UPI0024DFBC7A|nr:calcium homeostasis modulator protein 2-like [Triplophysa dalaica]